jgi:hypothetical protein
MTLIESGLNIIYMFLTGVIISFSAAKTFNFVDKKCNCGKKKLFYKIFIFDYYIFILIVFTQLVY